MPLLEPLSLISSDLRSLPEMLGMEPPGRMHIEPSQLLRLCLGCIGEKVVVEKSEQ